MTSITADGDMLAALANVKELAEVRDGTGNVIGFFAPVTIEHAARYADAAAHLNPKEIKQAKEGNGPGRSTAEVLQRLQSLEKT